MACPIHGTLGVGCRRTEMEQNGAGVHTGGIHSVPASWATLLCVIYCVLRGSATLLLTAVLSMLYEEAFMLGLCFFF